MFTPNYELLATELNALKRLAINGEPAPREPEKTLHDLIKDTPFFERKTVKCLIEHIDADNELVVKKLLTNVLNSTDEEITKADKQKAYNILKERGWLECMKV